MSEARLAIGDWHLASSQQQKIIRTVLGDIKPSSLGITLGHDHLMTHPPEDVTDSDLVMNDVQAATRELEAFKRAGGGALVEMTTVDYGRDALRLEWASRESGVHVIAATGFNKGRFADRLTSSRSVDEISAWMDAGHSFEGMQADLHACMIFPKSRRATSSTRS